MYKYKSLKDVHLPLLLFIYLFIYTLFKVDLNITLRQNKDLKQKTTDIKIYQCHVVKR